MQACNKMGKRVVIDINSANEELVGTNMYYGKTGKRPKTI
jgi:ribosomal protein L21E